MRIVVSWFSDNCIFQATFTKEQLPKVKKLFQDQLGRLYDTAHLEILWQNLLLEFERDRLAEYGENHSFTDRIHSTFIVTYLT
jgi:hypothetical protein